MKQKRERVLEIIFNFVIKFLMIVLLIRSLIPTQAGFYHALLWILFFLSIILGIINFCRFYINRLKRDFVEAILWSLGAIYIATQL